MPMKPLPLKVTREDREVVFLYKYPGKKGEVTFSPNMMEIAIIRSDITTSRIIKEMIRRNKR